MKRRASIICIFLSVGYFSELYAQVRGPSPEAIRDSLETVRQTLKYFSEPFRIVLNVSGNESSVAASYIRREFRKFPDVEVVSGGPLDAGYDLVVHIVIMKTEVPQGYTLAIAILKPWYPYAFLKAAFSRLLSNHPRSLFGRIDSLNVPLLVSFLSCELRDVAFKARASRPEVFQNLIVRTHPPNLEGLCRELVAQIDNDYIEPSRQTKQELKHLLETRLRRLELLYQRQIRQ